MRRPTSTLAMLAALALAAAALGPPVLAQDEPGAADHAIVGAWIVDATPAVAEDGPELITFHADGSTRGAGPDGVTVGSWQATGDRSADVTFVTPFTDPASGAFIGLGRIRGSVEVAEDGTTFSATYTFEPPAAFAEGMGMPVGELGPSEATGERIVVEPMGEPVGPAPELPPPDEPGASPMAPDAPPMDPEPSPVG